MLLRTLCRNEKQNGEQCCECRDAFGDHAAGCPCGPLRNRRHNDLAEEYASIIEEAGGIARREVFVAEFSGVKEAWLDVWGYGVAELPDLLLDVTVRHPRAGWYRDAAASTPSAAASAGEREKYDRYLASAGRAVWPVAHETWGRLGPEAERLLVALAAAARRHAHRRGRPAGRELGRWRQRLDGILQRAVALQLIAAVHGLPGRRPVRTRPLDLAALEAGAFA